MFNCVGTALGAVGGGYAMKRWGAVEMYQFVVAVVAILLAVHSLAWGCGAFICCVQGRRGRGLLPNDFVSIRAVEVRDSPLLPESHSSTKKGAAYER